MFAQKNLKQFFSSKTNLTGIFTLLMAGYLFYIGDTKSAMESAIGGLGLIFLKDAVVKTK